MAIPLQLQIKAEGVTATERAIQSVAQSVHRAKTAIQPNQGAASAWNPYVSALQKVQGAQNSAAEAAKKLEQANKSAVSAGAASAWNPQIGAVKQYEHALRQATDAQRRLQDEQAKTKEQLGSARNFGAGMVAVGGAGAVALGNAGMAAGQEQMWLTAFTKMEGGAEAARKKLEELYAFAANTPYSMPGLVQQAQQLRAMGFASEELIPTIRTLGDAMAYLGQGEDVLQRVALNLGQIRGMEKPSAADLKQFTYAGLDVDAITSAGAGKTMNRAEISEMSGEAFVDTFLKGLEKEFGGGMAEMSKTLPGAVNRLGDSFFKLKVAIGGPLVPTLTALAEGISAIGEGFGNLPGPVKTAVAWIAAIGTGLVLLTGTIITTVAQIGLAKIGLDALNGGGGLKGLATGIFKLVPGVSGLGGAAKTAVGALTGAGGLTGALTVALPLAIATAIGFIIKSVEDARAKIADERAENKDNPVSDSALGTSAKTREGLEAQIADITARRQKEEEIAARPKKWGLPSSQNWDDNQRIDDAKITAQALKLTEDSLRRRLARMPSGVTSQVAGMQIIAPGGESTSAIAAPAEAAKKGKGKTTAQSKVESALEKQARDQNRLNAILAARNVDLGEVDIDALNDKIALTTDAAEKAGLQELKRRALRYQRDLKAQQQAMAKDEKGQSALQDRIAQSEIAIGSTIIEERFALAAARLESMRGEGNEKQVAFQLAQLEAQKVTDLAQLEAKYSDSFAEMGGLTIAKLKAKGITDRAKLALQMRGKDGIDDQTGAIAAITDRLRAGGSLLGNALTTRAPVTASAFAGGGRNGGALGGFNPMSAFEGVSNQQQRKIQATVNGRFGGYAPNGNIIIELIGGILEAPDNFNNAVGAID